MNLSTLALEMLVMFLLMLLGFYAYKRGIVTDPGVRSISGLVTNICAPAMVLGAALGSETRLSPAIFARSLGASLVIYAILIASGYLVCALLRVEKGNWYSYLMPTVFGNVGFSGYPVCLAVLGPDSLLYASVCNLMYNLLVYTYGKQLLARAASRDEQARETPLHALRRMLNAGTLSSLGALTIYLVRPQAPAALVETLEYAGSGTVFLSMLVLGCSLAASPLRQLVLSGWRAYCYLALRMLVLPIALVLILKLFVRDSLMLGTMAILVSLPGGSMPLMFCQELGLEGRDLSRNIVLTTLVCLGTIPVVCLFL